MQASTVDDSLLIALLVSADESISCKRSGTMAMGGWMPPHLCCFLLC